MSSFRSRHGLFIKWGRFQVGAFGRPAVLTVLVIVVAVFIGRLCGLW
jgi:hypothetical protein